MREKRREREKRGERREEGESEIVCRREDLTVINFISPTDSS